jgi:hypothetical protein
VILMNTVRTNTYFCHCWHSFCFYYQRVITYSRPKLWICHRISVIAAGIFCNIFVLDVIDFDI